MLCPQSFADALIDIIEDAREEGVEQNVAKILESANKVGEERRRRRQLDDDGADCFGSGCTVGCFAAHDTHAMECAASSAVDATGARAAAVGAWDSGQAAPAGHGAAACQRRSSPLCCLLLWVVAPCAGARCR